MLAWWLFGQQRPELFFQKGHDLEQIADNAIVATLKMGASGSLLTATITFEVFIPARCWIAPEMPQAMYRLGVTVLPV